MTGARSRGLDRRRGNVVSTVLIAIAAAALFAIPAGRFSSSASAAYGYQYCDGSGSVYMYCSTTSSSTSTTVSTTSTTTLSTTTTTTLSTTTTTTSAPVKPGKGCGDKNHVHEREYQCKITVKSISRPEGNSGVTPFTFTVSLSDTAIDTVTVGWATAPGTAATGSDFVGASGTLAFSPGTASKTITVSVAGDARREKSEAFYLRLLSPSANALIETAAGVGTITNDD
jgi:hypothetical protein